MPFYHDDLNFLFEAWERNREDKCLKNLFDVANTALNYNRDWPIKITMPAFTIDTQLSVGKFMKNVSASRSTEFHSINNDLVISVQLGVEAAFDLEEFDQFLSDGNLKLGDIKHRVIVGASEDGTLGATAASTEPEEFTGYRIPTDIVVDKSFIFYVFDSIQQVTLFAGKYTNPEN